MTSHSDPHAGPMPGDASYRQHFATPAEFKAAMRLAARLEAKGLSRRAWRVRWNLDGPQPPKILLPRPEIETYDYRAGRKAVSRPDVAGLVVSTGLSNWQLGRELNVAPHTIKNWRHGGRITPENYAKLKEFCEIRARGNDD